MELNLSESWLYTLGETELDRLAYAFNIKASGVVPILRDCIVLYIKRK